MHISSFGRAAALFLAAASIGGFATAQERLDPKTVKAAQAERQTERKQLQAQRRTVQAQLLKDEKACYQRFAVEDCLRDARTKSRAADNTLRAREVEINDAERREKAALRLQSIEDKQREQHDRTAAGERPAPMHATPRTPSGERSGAQRAQEARQRAEQQQAREASRRADQAARAAAEPQRRAEAVERYEAKQRAAQERRDKNRRSQAEAAATGRKPAASLPKP